MNEHTCPGNPLCRPTRREFITVGALGTVGFTLADLLKANSARAAEGNAAAAKAKSVIHIFLPGGISTLQCSAAL